MKIATKAGIGNELLENYLLYYACLISLPQWNIADLYT